MKIYISGPMTGIKNFNKPKFMEVEKKLIAKGFTVLNPGCLPLSKEISYDEYMTIDLAMLSVCDAIYLLEGWDNSRGAKIELKAAMKAEMIIFDENYHAGREIKVDIVDHTIGGQHENISTSRS